MLSGEIAFRLHDTYGFPVDLTVDMAAEYGVRVDREGFEEGRWPARRTRAGAGGAKADLARHAELGDLYQSILRSVGETGVPGLRRDRSGRSALSRSCATAPGYQELTGHGEAEIILDATPFYGEGGGQVGDRGAVLEQGGGSFALRRRGHAEADQRA